MSYDLVEGVLKSTYTGLFQGVKLFEKYVSLFNAPNFSLFSISAFSVEK